MNKINENTIMMSVMCIVAVVVVMLGVSMVDRFANLHTYHQCTIEDNIDESEVKDLDEIFNELGLE